MPATISGIDNAENNNAIHQSKENACLFAVRNQGVSAPQRAGEAQEQGRRSNFKLAIDKPENQTIKILQRKEAFFLVKEKHDHSDLSLYQQ
jgi:hypothetical protein